MNIEKIIKNMKEFDYSSIDTDEFFDGRDIDEFDLEWGNVYAKIN